MGILIPFLTGVITHLQTGMSHQVDLQLVGGKKTTNRTFVAPCNGSGINTSFRPYKRMFNVIGMGLRAAIMLLFSDLMKFNGV